MTINNLSKEIVEIEKALFGLKEEFESCFANLLPNIKKNIFQAQNFSKVGFYDYYPYLFQDEFKNVSRETVRTLAISGALYLQYLLLNDHLMDSKDLINSSNLLYGAFLHEKSLSLLHSLFSYKSVFWKYFKKYNKEFTNALFLEQIKHFGIISPYSYSEFEVISRGKAAIAKCATAALAILNGTPEKIKPLEQSQNYFYIALQLNDDLQDWKEDYLNRNYSYLLTTIIYENQLVEEVKSNNPPDLETIGRVLYLSKIAENQMEKAVISLEKATSYGGNFLSWIDNIKKYQLKSEELKNKFINMRNRLLFSQKKVQQKHTKKIKLGNTKLSFPVYSESQQVEEKLKFHINRALDYILTQRELNFSEMSHKMVIVLAKGFGRKFDYQEGDIFQRALLIDTLLDARSYYDNANEIIKKEVEYLVSGKLKNVRGGWSYFPELPELPPDADDLGQVLQVLVRSKYKKIDKAVSGPVSLLLSQCSYDDGTFETWIVNNDDTSKETDKIKNAIKSMWQMRKGKDNEVQANILYGLFLYDYKHLKKRIVMGVDTLEKRQNDNGYWKSTWYWGNYYATYVAVRIIKSVKTGSYTLKKAEQFLLSTQNYDGGWGTIGSDPLNTALALLTLFLLNSKSFISINNGIKYLFATQNQRGYWDKIEFGKIVTPGTIFTYKSKTITTQFCLKALVSINSYINLEKILDFKKESFTIPKIKVDTIYKSLKNISSQKVDNNKEKLNLINLNYVNTNKNLFDVLPSIKKSKIAKAISDYKKEEISDLICKVDQENIIEICEKSLYKCFKKLPMNKMPQIYLWIGDYSFLSECEVINDAPAIIISIEFFSDIKLSKRNNKQTYYKTRIRGVKNSIPIIIANQYARLILKQMGVLRGSFLSKLYEMGFAAYFSKETFPEVPLASHLFFTSAELEWCQRNEWFLKREIKPYLQSKDDNIINRYFSVSENNNGKWFPDRTGCFTGYRIIEEYLNKTYTSTIRDLITESPIEVVAGSRFFNISN